MASRNRAVQFPPTPRHDPLPEGSALPAGPISLHIDPPTSATLKWGQVRAMGYRLLPGRGYGDQGSGW
jgi:hypothetical protein